MMQSSRSRTLIIIIRCRHLTMMITILFVGYSLPFQVNRRIGISSRWGKVGPFRLAGLVSSNVTFGGVTCVIGVVVVGALTVAGVGCVVVAVGGGVAIVSSLGVVIGVGGVSVSVVVGVDGGM